MPISKGLGIPFSEIIERVQDLTRTNIDSKQRIRGIVNEVYTLDIPKEYDWSFLKSSSAISVLAEHKSGYASVTTQGTAITLQSSNTISAAYTGRKIKFSGNANIYDFTFSQSTGGTISPPLSGIANVSTGGYTIFQNIYTLPADFDRFPVNGGLLFYSAGQPTPLPELLDDDYYEQVSASPSSTPNNCRLVGYDTAGNRQFEVVPAPSQVYILLNEYLKVLPPMSENTMGTVVITSNQTAVTGTGTIFTQMNTGDYLRFDPFGKGADSVWYQISAISSDTNMTLAANFRKDSSVTGSFTICPAPRMPYRLQDALIYGTVRKLLPDEKDPMLAYADKEYQKIIVYNKNLEQSRHAKDDVELIAEDYQYRR